MAFSLDKRLTDAFVKFNKLYFDNQLPQDTQVGWKDMEFGVCNGRCSTDDAEGEEEHHTLYINREFKAKGHRSLALITLLHEMAHVKLYPYKHHGKKFDLEMLRLAASGAFNGLW